MADFTNIELSGSVFRGVDVGPLIEAASCRI
jgi:hypothetical protein